jgi:predicted DNA-binding protein YlxM (UPF0122 family)
MTPAQKQIAALINDKEVSYQWVGDRLGWSKQNIYNKVHEANDIYTDDYNKIITLLNRVPSKKDREAICNNVSGSVLQTNALMNSSLEKLNKMVAEITEDNQITPEENLRLLTCLDNFETEITQKIRNIKQKFSGSKQ